MKIEITQILLDARQVMQLALNVTLVLISDKLDIIIVAQ